MSTAQRIYGQLIPDLEGALAVYPVNYTFDYGCRYRSYIWHTFTPNFSFDFLSVDGITSISLISCYTISGNVDQTEEAGWTIFNQVEETDQVTLYPLGIDDVIWVYNVDRSSGLLFYQGTGNCGTIVKSVYTGEANITNLIAPDIENCPDGATLKFEISDYWGFCFSGSINYIAVEYNVSNFVNHAYSGGGYCNYKKYGFTGVEV